MDPLEALERSEVVEERIELIKLLESGDISSRSAATALHKCWKSSRIEQVDYRHQILATSSSQIPLIINDGPLLVKYAEIASEACTWLVDDVSNKARLPVSKMVSTLFSPQSELVSYESDTNLRAFVENYVRFVKSAWLSESFRDAPKEIQMQLSASLRVVTDAMLRKLAAATPQNSIIRGIYTSLLCSLFEIGSESSLPSLLNVSWRVITLLLEMESFHDTASGSISISDVITTLLSLASQSLTLAVRPTQSLLDDSSAVAKNQQLTMVKFYTVHSLRIARSFIPEAVSVQESIANFAVNVLTLVMVLDTGRPSLEAVGNDISVQIAPASLAFFHTLLRSEKIHIDSKSELIEYITRGDIVLADTVVNLLGEDSFRQSYTSAGQIVVFIHLLQQSKDFDPIVLLRIAKNLDWVLDRISEMPVYAMVFQQKPATTTVDGKQSSQLLILQALEAFAMAAAGRAEIWEEVESFLFRNVIHRVSICQELLLDLWSFILKFADDKLCESHLDALLSLFRCSSSSSPSSCGDDQIVGDFARAICRLTKFIPDSVRSRLRSSVFKREMFSTKASAVAAARLLGHGFAIPETTASELVRIALDVVCSASSTTKVEAFSILLELSSHCKSFHRDTPNRIRNLLLSIIEKSTTTIESPLLSKAVLGLSKFKTLLSDSDISKALIALSDRLSSCSEISPGLKISLPDLLSSLAEVRFQEQDPDSQTEAAWRLCHRSLEEKHWGLVHAGLASFSEFAATTPCNNLWRFVPADAALSFDSSGSTVVEDGFMAALQQFLEKNTDRRSLRLTDADLELVRQECDSQRASQCKILAAQSGGDSEQEEQQPRPKQQQQQGIEAAAAAVAKIREGIDLVLREAEAPQRNEILQKLIAELQSLRDVPGTSM